MSYHAEKLAAEQAAGRRAIEKAVHQEALSKGFKELQRRFPEVTFGLALRKEGAVWVADTNGITSVGTSMEFATPFLGFPSDFLIAQISLVT